MSAGTQDITVEVEASFRMSATYLDADANPIDLTGCTAMMQIRKKAGTLPTGDAMVTLTSGDGITLGGSAGTVVIFISGARTAALTGRTAAYDVFLSFPSGGDVVKLLKGAVTIDAAVTVLP